MIKRVNKKNPCPICGKPDWCGYSENVVICMRVTSEKESRNGGWVHWLTDRPIRPYIKPMVCERPPNLMVLWRRWENKTNFNEVDALAENLGVDTTTLIAIGCARSLNAWAFPMKDAKGNLIGIRLRGDSGAKWAVKGSKQGLFIPSEYPYCLDNGTSYIVEGPTDLSAAMTIGLYAIGRPSCLGQEEMIVDYIREKKVRRAVIVTDNDEPGLNGARKLQSKLPVKSCLWIPPTKDIREFVKLGGKVSTIENSIKDLVWN